MNTVSDNQKQIAKYAKALSHPIRVYVIELLSKQSCCYSGSLTDELGIAKSTLSQHLKELKNAGLIKGEIEGPKVKYCLCKENIEEARLMLSNLLGINKTIKKCKLD